MEKHVPVLLDEVLGQLVIAGDGTYVDGTFGRGGHSRGILGRLGPRGRVLAMDRDPAAVKAGQALEREDPRFRIEQDSFGNLRAFLIRHGMADGVHGIVLDVGVSSPQLDDPARGFSFQDDGPLDMRMDPGSGESAAEWLATASVADIAGVLRRYGEEPEAGRIARAICGERDRAPLRTTGQLAALVARVRRGARPGRHPATQVFQAIRIHVNRELDELAAALEQAIAVLCAGGRLAVISFHSLEDRLVKRFLRDHSRVDPALARLPRVPASARPALRLCGGAIHAGEAEVARNPRARSAVLRVAERLA